MLRYAIGCLFFICCVCAIHNELWLQQPPTTVFNSMSDIKGLTHTPGKKRLLSTSPLCELCHHLTNALRFPARPQTSVDREAMRAFWRDGVSQHKKKPNAASASRGLHQMVPPRDEKEARRVIKACVSAFFSVDVFLGTFM